MANQQYTAILNGEWVDIRDTSA